MQFVEVELDPGEATVAEAGGMMYMEDGIEMETIFGDGSAAERGFLGALMGAGKRLLTGESLFMTVFLNRGNGKRKLAFGAPYPGKIIAVHLCGDWRRVDLRRRIPFLQRPRASVSASRSSASWAWGCSAVRVSSCSVCREMGGPSFTRAARLMQRELKPGEVAARGHGLHCRFPAQRGVRHPIRRQDQERAVRRRRPVLCDACAGPGRSGCSRCR